MTQRIVVAAPAGWQSPSARDRLGPVARAGDWNVDAIGTGTFPEAEQVETMLAHAGSDAALVLQRVMPKPDDLDRVRRSYRHVIFDIDDAIYAVPPDLRSPSALRAAKGAARLLLRGSSTASSRRRPLQRTLGKVDVCVVGNSILADFARRHARNVVEIPTTFDPVPDLPTDRPQPPIVVWHGILANLQHLSLVGDALRALSNELHFRVQVIASATWSDAPIPIEFVPWTPEALRDGLLTASVGLAPLTDDAWTRGKCAFRAIQYGAYGLPAVASPVGVTDRVVRHGKTGYLARSPTEWESALRQLLTSPERVREMGAAAHGHIADHYSNEIAITRWRQLLEELDQR